MAISTGEFGRDASAGPCAEAAAYALLIDQPEASAGRALFPPKALWIPPLIFAVGACLLAPQLAGYVVVCAVSAFVAAVSALRLLGALAPPAWSPRVSVKVAPAVTVIVALYNEARVVAGLMTQLSRLDYPRHRLEVILALEQDDRVTIAAARAAARRAGSSSQARTSAPLARSALTAARPDAPRPMTPTG